MLLVTITFNCSFFRFNNLWRYFCTFPVISHPKITIGLTITIYIIYWYKYPYCCCIYRWLAGCSDSAPSSHLRTKSKKSRRCQPSKQASPLHQVKSRRCQPSKQISPLHQVKSRRCQPSKQISPLHQVKSRRCQPNQQAASPHHHVRALLST